MEWIQPIRRPAPTLAILPAAFNPPTQAHVALAQAALSVVDQVVLVLPRRLPHKAFDGATFEQRRELLRLTVADYPWMGAAISEGGLFIEIARECRADLSAPADLWMLCGRDAAERIVNWDYGHPGAFDRMLEEFGLLVVPRGTAYDPPPEYADRIRTLPLAPESQAISSSDVRRRIRQGFPWEALVPTSTVECVRAIYS